MWGLKSPVDLSYKTVVYSDRKNFSKYKLAGGTVLLPNFEHHVNKQFLSLQLKNLIYKPTYIFMNNINKFVSCRLGESFVYMVFKIRYMFKIRQIKSSH